MNILTKNCPRCNIEKESNKFNKNKSRHDGLSGYCKKCERVYFLEQKSKNPEKIKALQRKRAKEWASKNKDKVREVCQRWRSRNIEKLKEKERRRFLDNPEKERARWKKYRDEHPNRNKEYREKNIEKIKEKNKMYWKNNPEKRTVYSQKRRTLKNEGKGVSSKEWKEMMSFYNNTCVCCGMKSKLTMDHVIPLSLGGRHEIENIQPLCQSCNSKKHTSFIDYRGQQ